MAALFFAGAAEAQVASAEYQEPTRRYTHGVLGDDVEWSSLRMRLTSGRTVRVVLPPDRVFEDVAPRLVDIDQDGAAEVMVVESSVDEGSRLAVYGPAGLVVATPFIGQRFRWLAPIGAADLDSDGHVEVAYIDRPHLAKILRVWRFRNGSLQEIAATSGFTNHRIGERDIAGGIRDCGGGPEMIVADADWRFIMSVRFQGEFSSRALRPHEGRRSFFEALSCR